VRRQPRLRLAEVAIEVIEGVLLDRPGQAPQLVGIGVVLGQDRRALVVTGLAAEAHRGATLRALRGGERIDGLGGLAEGHRRWPLSR
jgi:hypothetical protein